MNVCLLVYLEFKGGQYFTCLFLARNSFFDHRKKERKSIFLTFAVGFYTPIFFFFNLNIGPLHLCWFLAVCLFNARLISS